MQTNFPSCFKFTSLKTFWFATRVSLYNCSWFFSSLSFQMMQYHSFSECWNIWCSSGMFRAEIYIFTFWHYWDFSFKIAYMVLTAKTVFYFLSSYCQSIENLESHNRSIVSVEEPLKFDSFEAEHSICSCYSCYFHYVLIILYLKNLYKFTNPILKWYKIFFKMWGWGI